MNVNGGDSGNIGELLIMVVVEAHGGEGGGVDRVGSGSG